MADSATIEIAMGISTTGVKSGTLMPYLYSRDFNNGFLRYFYHAGSDWYASENIVGSGNPSGDTGGNEVWKEYEISVVGNTCVFNIDGVEVFRTTLPENINPLTGTMRITPAAAGDIMIRNMVAY